MKRSFEEAQMMPGEHSVTSRHADVIATIGDPLLRDSMDKIMQIGAYYGDQEAYLAQTTADIVGNLEVVAKTLRFHPEKSIASVLCALPHDEKADYIHRIRVMLDRIEANNMPDIPDNATPVMLTGTRKIEDPDGVREALVRVIKGLSKNGPIVGIAGGAAGADQLFAEALIETETYFVMVVPNWAYPYKYDRIEDFTAIKESPYCLGFEYTVERPEVANWGELWGSQQWWKDNFARNRDMIDRSQETGGHQIVCGPNHPRTIFDDTSISGGTAHCTRLMKDRGVTRAIYVPSTDPSNIVWVDFE